MYYGVDLCMQKHMWAFGQNVCLAASCNGVSSAQTGSCKRNGPHIHAGNNVPDVKRGCAKTQDLSILPKAAIL